MGSKPRLVTVDVVDARSPGAHQPIAGSPPVGQFPRRALFAGGGIVVGGIVIGGLPRLATSAPSARQDAEILAFALELERLQEAFYAEALRSLHPDGELGRFARVVGGHERAHREFIEKALGGDAKPPSEFDFGDTLSDTEGLPRRGRRTRGDGGRRLQRAGDEPDPEDPRVGGDASSRWRPATPPGPGVSPGRSQLRGVRTARSVRTAHKPSSPRPGWWRNEWGRPIRVPGPAASGWRRSTATAPSARPPSSSLGRTRGGLLRAGLASALIGALAWPRAAARSRSEGRLRRAQLRALARVPAGGLLHRGRAPGVARGQVQRAGPGGRRARACARRGPPRRCSAAAAIKRPEFDFQGVTEDQSKFRATAVAFEDLAAAAYKEEAPRLNNPEFLAAAVRVHSVEARHAAWIRRLAGALPAADAFDQPKSRDEVKRLVASTKFVVTDPVTRSRGKPRFTG